MITWKVPTTKYNIIVTGKTKIHGRLLLIVRMIKFKTTIQQYYVICVEIYEIYLCLIFI